MIAAHPPATSSDVELTDVSKRFGSVTAVEHVTLAIHSGEFFSFLGPSGSGKTTCLRMIAGFEQPTDGRILLHGHDVAGSPPYDRDVNTVFQDYALFPHLNVAGNVEYGLKVKRVAKAERRRRALEALAMVRLEGFGRRRINQLSGGQRQRVALARALVNRPRVLLLDEPLGALDLKLREEMQIELKRIQSEVGITFIYVTHDQDEALAMSDRLAVFDAGRLQQVGTPAEVYEHPASAFVAGFVGTSNLIDGALAQRLRGSSSPFTVRPEKISLLSPEGSHDPEWGEVRVTGTIRSSVYLGERTRYVIDLDGGGQLVAVEQNRITSEAEARTKQGRPVRLVWNLTNYGDVSPFLKMQQYNSLDGTAYGMPHGWGANLLMWNTSVVTTAPNSWSVVWDPSSPYKGKVTAYDDPTNIADAALYLMKTQPGLGIKDPYALDKSQFDAAINLLKQQKAIVGEYWSDYLKAADAFEKGSLVIGSTWQVIANTINGAKPNSVETVLPKEGATAWSDTWMISSKAAHPNCMYKWMNYISSPQVQAQVAEWFGEAPANPKACGYTQDKTHCTTYHATDAAFAKQLWYWTTPTAQCLDGRKNVVCMDNQQWSQAWNTLRAS